MVPEPDHLTKAADILVVDDDIDNLRLLTEILSQAGYRVRSAEKPQLALESAWAYPPGLIFLDVMMPEMDGFEVCRRLGAHELTRDIPIIFISALQDVDDKLRGFEAGGVDFISKPFHKLEILARVNTHLQLRDLQVNLEQQIAERTKELRESEGKFRALIEQSPVSIQIHGLDGKLQQSNTAYAKLYALDNDTLEKLFEKYNVRTDEQAEALGIAPYIEKVYSGEDVVFPPYQYDGVDTLKTLDFEKPVSRKCWIQTVGFPLKDSSGNLTSVVFMSEDITERKQAEQELRESEARFRATFEQAAVGIAHVSIDSRFLLLNQKFCDIVGYSHEEMLERTFQDITHPDDLDADLNHVEQLLAGEADTYAMEKRYFHKNGQIVWINLTVSLLRMVSGEPDYFIAVVEDISSRKQIEHKLNESERNYRTLAEQAQDGITVVQDGKIKFANRRLVELSGHTIKELLNTLFTQYIPTDELPKIVDVYQRRMMGETAPAIYDAVIQHKDTSRVDVEFNAGLMDYNGKPAVLVILRDISERKQKEREIQSYQQHLKDLASQLTLTEEQERRRIAGELHDHVGQSLALARMQIAAAQKASSDAKRSVILDEASETLRDTIQETRSLVFDLSSPIMNELGLSAAISEWLQVRVEKGAGLKTEFIKLGPNIPLTDDVRAILFRNVRELLTNVIRHAQATVVRVTLEQTNTQACITIQDDGIGFKADEVSPTMSRSGGFGLFSIRERMTDMGGAMEIRSAPGEGSTITLSVSNPDKP